MTKKDFITILLLTAICVAVFVGFYHIVMQYPVVGIYGMVYFAIYPKIKSAYQKRKEKTDKKDEP